jgi:DNA-binding LacI/PurR family transcriptional regulator
MTLPADIRCTLEDVAAHAGVSRATVSRVVNGSPRVSDAARAAVEQAIEELGYAPNRAARSLAAQRSDTVALVVSEPSTRLFTDPFFAGTIRGVAAALAGSRYQLVLLMAQGESDRGGVERHLLRGNTDGVLLLSARRDDPLPHQLVGAGIPCVVAGRPSQADAARSAGTAATLGPPEISYVDADNVGGACDACAHLIRRGCGTIATVAGPADMAPGADRLTGWRQALAAAGRTAPRSLVASADFTREGGAVATRALLDRHPEIDGIFAASDLMAMGVLDVLRSAGRRVPEDVAVVGFDDSDLAPGTAPPLTTVRQPIEELGAEMGRLVLDQLDGAAPPRAVILGTELVVRASA